MTGHCHHKYIDVPKNVKMQYFTSSFFAIQSDGHKNKQYSESEKQSNFPQNHFPSL